MRLAAERLNEESVGTSGLRESREAMLRWCPTYARG